MASLSTKPATQNETGPYLTTASLQFLMELREHNQREWFERNRTRYESELRDPFLNLIADLRAPLKKFSPDFVVDPSPTGGSMMRIYRDIRFSRDKARTKLQSQPPFTTRKAKMTRRPLTIFISNHAVQ